MKRSSTNALAIALSAAALAGAAVAEGPPEGAWRGTLTPGATLHFPSERFGASDTSSWRDQYEFMARKDDAPPWHLDLLDAELGWQRDDETWLFRLERTAPFAFGERTLLDLDWLGLRVEGEAFRIRTDELRLFPVGTGDTGFPSLPRLGTRFNDDSGPNDRFFVRRYGGGGEIRIRPDAFGLAWPLAQISLRGSQELRTGQRQDRFLLSASEVGTGPDTARFRGRTGDLDQEVTTLGARLVAEPFGFATGVLDYEFQRFHESAGTALVGDVSDPNVRPSPIAAQRALFFVPDTRRHTGSLRVSRRIGEATLHGGAFASHLSQTGARPPLQRAADLRGNDVTTASAHAAADVPITSWLSFDAYGKASIRRNGLDRGTPFFGDGNRTQIYPFLKELTDVRSGAELVATPMRGARVAAGWRMRDVNRDLEYPALVAADGIAQRAIYPAVSLVREDSAQHEGYVRGHARLLKRTRIAGEAGYAWAPAIGSPTELEQAVFAEGRVTHGLARPIALTISLFGNYRDGESDGFELTSTFAGRSQTKDFERRTADWGVSLAAVPRRGTAVFLSVTQQLDRQRFPHLRSNAPRLNGAAFVRFFRDSDLGYESDARILALGGTQRITPKIDLSLMGWMGFVDGRFPRGGSTADALEAPNQIDLTYGSVEAAIGVQVLPALRLGFAYRYDAYKDDARLDEPNRDGHDHAVTLSATYEFAIAGGE
jgi:hypothetical protein